mmetsp:Transcript_3660/g.7582  ORF Transcript_3660/g.7582 Transcript_3660/m.7582 type:complete len:255 (-) Transcript_3660:226-990(-)
MARRGPVHPPAQGTQPPAPGKETRRGQRGHRHGKKRTHGQKVEILIEIRLAIRPVGAAEGRKDRGVRPGAQTDVSLGGAHGGPLGAPPAGPHDDLEDGPRHRRRGDVHPHAERREGRDGPLPRHREALGGDGPVEQEGTGAREAPDRDGEAGSEPVHEHARRPAQEPRAEGRRGDGVQFGLLQVQVRFQGGAEESEGVRRTARRPCGHKNGRQEGEVGREGVHRDVAVGNGIAIVLSVRHIKVRGNHGVCWLLF